LSDITTAPPGAITLLSRLAKHVMRNTPEDVLGMRFRHFTVLSYLYEHGGVPQHELADVFCIDANNLVILLNELESLGYAQRERDPQDRRRHIVLLTPSGRAAFKRAEKAREVIEDDVLSGLDAEERDTLRRLLAKALNG
jgi:DNA-binding MarR family transcriptional regulator